ncbi:MAG: ThiF family adenylyltransferase [Kofleriaceae bacterium]
MSNTIDRYSRQRLFFGIGDQGQASISGKRVTLFGCGALGTHLAQHLVRAGVGFIRICDRDFVELDNLQRQVLFDEDDVRSCMPKAEAAAAKLRRINSNITIEARVVDISYANVEDQIADVDLVVDGTDNFDTRYLLNEACIKAGKSWVYGGVVGSTGMVFMVHPGKTACFACMLPEQPEPGTAQTCDTAGALSPAVAVVAALQSAEALKFLAGKHQALSGKLMTIDVWNNEFQSMAIDRLDRCPVCVGHEQVFLTARAGGTATSLCGRNAVQITPSAGSTIDLIELEQRLKAVSPAIKRNEFLIRADLEGCETTIFPDGRAIVKGTSDMTRARALYARFIGS